MLQARLATTPALAAMAELIDHTVLRPEAVAADIERACRVAVELGCAGVCINPINVALASRLLKGSSVKVVAVVGFPFGATFPAVKVLECGLLTDDEKRQAVELAVRAGTTRIGTSRTEAVFSSRLE